MIYWPFRFSRCFSLANGVCLRFHWFDFWMKFWNACRRTFSLCLRGGGGLSGALCRFMSSSIVDLAWGWGECMSRRDGLGAGITSTLLSPGDFLKYEKTQYICLLPILKQSINLFFDITRFTVFCSTTGGHSSSMNTNNFKRGAENQVRMWSFSLSCCWDWEQTALHGTIFELTTCRGPCSTLLTTHTN